MCNSAKLNQQLRLPASIEQTSPVPTSNTADKSSALGHTPTPQAPMHPESKKVAVWAVQRRVSGVASHVTRHAEETVTSNSVLTTQQEIKEKNTEHDKCQNGRIHSDFQQ
jgi:hypothetical protein